MTAINYRDVAVLMPTREGMMPALARVLVGRGARLFKLVGHSDIAQARCILLGKMLEELRFRESMPNGPPPFRWVFWLDDDVSASLAVFAAHLREANALRAASGGAPIAVAGRYVMRSRPTAYAARANGLPTPPGTAHKYPRVYAGMGAMLYPIDALEALLGRVPMLMPRLGQDFEYPAAFATGPAQDAQGRWTWAPEDFTHCAYLDHAGVPVVLGSVCYRHAGRMPDEGTMLYGNDEVSFPVEWFGTEVSEVESSDQDSSDEG